MIQYIVASAFVLATAAATGCEPGWRYLSSTQSCYKLLDELLPWSVAEIRCLYDGGHHVSIGSYEENQFIFETARHQEMWVGAAFFGSVYEYAYSDHTPFGYYENWDEGYRPSMNRARRCIKLDRSSGRWFQSCCKKIAVSVCKKAATTGWDSTNNLDRF